MEQLFRAVSDVLSGLGPNGATDEALAFVAWGRCAGELLKARTKPVGFFEGRLVVAVEDRTWRRHLEELSPQMLVKLNALLGGGKVRFIEFRIDPASVKRSQLKKTDEIRPKVEIEASLIVAAEAINDAALREQFLSAAVSCIDSKRSE